MSFWTEERLDRLQTMWLAGVGSGGIAEVLAPIGRNAVMGKINRLGLMGRKGEGAMADASDDEVRLKLAGILAEAAARNDDGSPRALGMEDELAVVQTAIMVGRRSPRVAALSCPDPARAGAIIARLDETGIWPEDRGPPAGWFVERESAESACFLVDLMVLADIFRKGSGEDGQETVEITDRGRAFVAAADAPRYIAHGLPVSDAAPVFRDLATRMLEADSGSGCIPYRIEGMMAALASLEFGLERDVVTQATGLHPYEIAEAIGLVETLGAWRPEMREEQSKDDVPALRAYLVMLASIMSAAMEDDVTGAPADARERIAHE
jgi:hypothetical protein